MSKEDADEKTMYMLKKAFGNADKLKSGFVQTTQMEAILNAMGSSFQPDDLEQTIKQVDITNEGKLNFEKFVCIAITFMEEEDYETVVEELRGAFRLYDKAGKGFIEIEVLRPIFLEMEPSLSQGDLDQIIIEIDEEGNGRLNFKGFMKLVI